MLEEIKDYNCPKDVSESQVVKIDVPSDKIMSQEEIDNLLTRINTED